MIGFDPLLGHGMSTYFLDQIPCTTTSTSVRLDDCWLVSTFVRTNVSEADSMQSNVHDCFLQYKVHLLSDREIPWRGNFYFLTNSWVRKLSILTQC